MSKYNSDLYDGFTHQKKKNILYRIYNANTPSEYVYFRVMNIRNADEGENKLILMIENKLWTKYTDYKIECIGGYDISRLKNITSEDMWDRIIRSKSITGSSIFILNERKRKKFNMTKKNLPYKYGNNTAELINQNENIEERIECGVMKTYNVICKRVSEIQIEIPAESENEAIELAKKGFETGDYYFESDDVVSNEFIINDNCAEGFEELFEDEGDDE